MNSRVLVIATRIDNGNIHGTGAGQANSRDVINTRNGARGISNVFDGYCRRPAAVLGPVQIGCEVAGRTLHDDLLPGVLAVIPLERNVIIRSINEQILDQVVDVKGAAIGPRKGNILTIERHTEAVAERGIGAANLLVVEVYNHTAIHVRGGYGHRTGLVRTRG